jgi:hypothetical protein
MIVPGTKYRILLPRLTLKPRKWKYHAIVGGTTQREPIIPSGVSSMLGIRYQELLTKRILIILIDANKSKA